MPEYRTDLVLEQIRGFAEDLGDEVVDTDVDPILIYKEDNNKKERNLRGHQFAADGTKYLVGGHPDIRVVLLAFGYDIYSAVDDNTTKNKIINKEKENINTNMQIVAEEESVLEYKYEIKKLSSNFSCFVQMEGIGSEPGTVLFAKKSMFPYEESFSIEQFSQARRSVLRCGRLLQRATERAFSVTTDPEQSDSLKLEIDTDRM